MPPTTAAMPPATPSKEEELRLKVTGMHCAGCAASVQQAVEAQPGVSSASVSVADGLATITGSDLRRDDLIRVIRNRGFEAESVERAPAPSELRSEIEIRQIRSERRWRRRAIVGLGLWIPMGILHWIFHGEPWMPWVLLIGATAVLGTAGAGFYRSAVAAARRLTTNMDTLIAIGASTAYGFSLVVFIARLVGHELLDPSGAPLPLYFTEAAALLGIISLGHWLEARASARAGSAVRELLRLQPDDALLIDESGHFETIRSADVRHGDRVLIRPGDRVVVDGVVITGDSELDEAVVTGESMPVVKGPGDTVIAGSLNTTGRLVIEASVDGRHTTVTRIAELVQRAQSSRANVQRLADKVCAVFVPAVLTIAALTLVGWWIAGDLPRGLIAMVTVLVISCPCALGLATPMAVMVGTGSASRKGILVKSATALEKAGSAKRVIFDKTGTLTTGRQQLVGIETADEHGDDREMLRLAASVEMLSEHPVARAIVRAANEWDLERRPVGTFKAIPGQGVRGVVDERTVQVLRDESATCRVIVNDELMGTITVADATRSDAAEAIRRLRDMGLEVRMLSGDRTETANEAGRSLGLLPQEVVAEATPESKLEIIESFGAGTIMVGDGINDAAALARADLGIAMASGTNIAIESADVVIPGEAVHAVPDTIHLARSTLRTIKQNLFFAFIYNAVAIPAAALGLLGIHGPLIAAIAMGASDVTVVGNALRLKAMLSR